MKLQFNSENYESLETYFIADIAANHDGSLERALELIRLAAESGANAAKFQNFKAETIVSARGFKELGRNDSHQSNWEKDVYSVYNDAELPLEWTDSLISECEKNNIEYFTAPYDLDYIDFFAEKMPYFKVGSGDITWSKSLERMAKTGKPILLATGASELKEIMEAVEKILEFNVPLVLMQCNTNYTGQANNLNYINLRVIKEFKELYPNLMIGLSDHSQGHIAVLGAVALGARVIEKHFTDDTKRKGPDHSFSLDPKMWKSMVEDTRRLEAALGDGKKKVEKNEIEARIVQRRALRYTREMRKGEQIKEGDLISLRPCPPGSLEPSFEKELIGKELVADVSTQELVTRRHFEK